MKKAILLTMIIGILALAGCKKSTACWYPIEGGHINLDNVTRISSEARLLLWADEDIVKNEWGLKEINKDTLIDGVITESNIEKAIASFTGSTIEPIGGPTTRDLSSCCKCGLMRRKMSIRCCRMNAALNKRDL